MKNLIRGIAVLLTAVFLCFNIYYELAPGITVAPEQKFVFAAIFAVLLRAALFCGVPDNTRPIRRRLYMLALFLYYIWVLLNVLFFDNAFGRGFGHTSLDMVNLEPLRTVKNYLLAYGYGNISLRLVVLNLAGNLIAFAPMGVFLPALFRWQRSIFFFTASLTLSIIINKRGDTTCFLCFSNGMDSQSCFTGRFRAINLDDTSAGIAANAQCYVQSDRA